MPDTVEIEKIRTDLASDYTIDLAGIRADANKLRALVASGDPISSADIYDGSTTYTYGGPIAFVPDLETLEYSDIAADQRLSTKRVEQNLEEALRYSQSCLQLRHEYGELAKLRNDARFKGEEFMRLDMVHQQEVAAGLYKLPWKEAESDRRSLEEAISQTQLQQTIAEDMMRSGATGQKYSSILSDANVQGYINTSAEVARLSSSTLRTEIRTGTAETTAYRTRIEYATWLQQLTGVKANLAQLNGRLTTSKNKEEYLRKDEGFRSHRAAISRQLAYLQLREHCRDNSALNYSERLTNHKALFDGNFRCLVERVKLLKGGLSELYGIDVPLADPERGHVLDELAAWLINVQNQITKFKRGQRLFVHSIWSEDKLKISPRGNNGQPLETFEFELAVDTNGVSGERPLLRGIAFEYAGDYKRPVTLLVLPPASAYRPVDRGSTPDTVQFGRVYGVEAASDLKPQQADLFWNGAPNGNWRIKGMFNQNAGGTIEAIVMHVWLAAA